MALTLITAAAAQPITTAEAKLHLRIDASETAEDTRIDAFIAAAVERVEAITGRQLITATWEMQYWDWPCEESFLEVPKPPLIAVSSLKYLDGDGVEQTLVLNTDYYVDAPSYGRCRRGRVYPAFNTSWPTIQAPQPGAIKLRYTAGYGASGSSVPSSIKQAMLLMIGSWYEHREDIVVGTISQQLPRAAESILKPYYSRAATRQVAA